ncbi:putative nuclease HARBI1 [Cucumis melo var. makuwa]|uniref:Nuclease HARBI1 n=1 Tax=Cucumis melo var. makuwa TaxID=1194695 RepID=A0A5A7T1N7_CUCMM|nr:putative nuclease HARBI1 [Cucumis melo var. makuwa]
MKQRVETARNKTGYVMGPCGICDEIVKRYEVTMRGTVRVRNGQGYMASWDLTDSHRQQSVIWYGMPPTCVIWTTTGLQSTEIVDVEEMVVMFLHVLAHGVKNCMVEREFLQSGRTISWQFNIVLLTELQLHEELLKKPQPGTNGCTDPRWKRWEGSAAYSRILRDAISRSNGLKMLKGYYY